MSISYDPSFTQRIYAINNGRPPQTQVFEFTEGQSPELPSGFYQVDEDTYRDAVRQQESKSKRDAAIADHDWRQGLANKRQQLVDTGLTWEQANILVPDPYGDPTIGNA